MVATSRILHVVLCLMTIYGALGDRDAERDGPRRFGRRRNKENRGLNNHNRIRQIPYNRDPSNRISPLRNVPGRNGPRRNPPIRNSPVKNPPIRNPSVRNPPSRNPPKNGKSMKEVVYSLKEYVHQHRRQPSTYCFQCAYSPDKDVYETIRAPSIVKDRKGNTRLAYKTRLMKVRKQGGWDKCVGPFDNSEANEFGIDVKECDNTCYARLEKNGNIFRGCYKGAHDVNPYRYGCHEQQGSIWCFCKGHVCNNNEITDDTGTGSNGTGATLSYQ